MKQSNRRDVVPQAQVRQIVVPTRAIVHAMRIHRLLVLALLCAPALVRAQPTRLPLTSLERLRPVNTQIDTVTFKGQRGLRATQAANGPDGLIHLEGLSFGNGTLEVELAGAPAAGAGEGARGFVGLAFRVRPAQGDAPAVYDAFYLRPTNGRALDQERRNHTTQYISHPEWTWSRLRRETPSRYESYVDMEPDTWTKLRIEVQGDTARLFVHGQTQPSLIVTDVKTGAQGVGGVALWIGPGSVAHFRNLVVTPRK